MNDAHSKFTVAVVADSAASIPDEFHGHPQLLIVPMRLNLDGQSYFDGEDLSPDEFYRKQKSSDGVASTSAPSPAAFLNAFEEAFKVAESVICLTVSSRYSSSSESARTAAGELDGMRMRVVDTQSAGGGEGLVLLETLRGAEAGLALDAVEKRADAVIQKTRLVAMLDTLHYLWKGGRVPRLAAAGTSLLNIKPMFELRLGDASSLARPRTRRRAMNKLVEYVEKNSNREAIHVCVMHSDCPDDALEIRAALETTFDCRELYVSELTPVLGAHLGPGMLGIALWPE